MRLVKSSNIGRVTHANGRITTTKGQLPYQFSQPIARCEVKSRVTIAVLLIDLFDGEGISSEHTERTLLRAFTRKVKEPWFSTYEELVSLTRVVKGTRDESVECKLRRVAQVRE